MRRLTRSRRVVPPMLLVVCALSACADRPGPLDHREGAVNPPNEHTIRLETPDASFRLTAEERADVRDGFDVDALERLLAAVEPDARPTILDTFRRPSPEDLQAGRLSTPATRMGDPALQPLLDEVWAPAWERFAPEGLDDPSLNYPGKQLARERRTLREQP